MAGVDGRVELKAGIGRSPGRDRDHAPERPGLHPADDRPVGTRDQGPVAIHLDGLHELVRNPHGVVGILPGHRHVGSLLPAEWIGRASWRERVCQYVYVSMVAVSLETKQKIV